MSNPFSIPYPITPHRSIYGPLTANTNFCEADHQFSSYIAELINTLTNITYLLYSIHGLHLLSHRNRLSMQTALPHIGLACVGLGSAAFHATLLKHPQLADEIGMAIPTGAVLSQLLSFDIPDPSRRRVVYAACVATVVAVYVVHCISFTNWIHYPAFGAMVLLVGRRCRVLIRGIADEKLRRELRGYARLGRVLSLGSFGLWLVDRLCCELLMRAREWVGLPWGWLLELHGWWHVGTAMGAFVFIQVAQLLMEGVDGLDRSDLRRRLSPFELRLWGDYEAGGRMPMSKSKDVRVNGVFEEKRKNI